MANGLTPVGVELVAAGGAQFAAGVQAASKQLNVLERSAKSATAGVNLLGQIGIGVLREIGAIGVRALAQAGRAALNFASDLTAAALENSALSKTVDTLYNSLVEVTRVSFTPLANQINQLATQAAPAFLGVVQRAEEAFAGLASNALTYGQNVVAQFAQGLWDGFVYVVDALTGLGDLISGWLAPGSPPKILPELDQWGTDAMNVYLSGWTKANFDIFNTIGSEIESLLRAQAPKNDTGLIPRILGTREAIAAAVEQARQMGQVTTESLNNIYKAAGATTPAVQDYLKSVFTLDLANKNLSAAQAELNRVTAEYQDLLKPIDAQLAGISESQQQLTDEQEKGRLAMVLADPGATASEKRQAQLRIEQIDAEARRRALIATQKVAVEAAQENVDAAQTQVTVAQSEYDSRKANIDLIVEQNRLLAEQAALLDRLSAAAGGGGGAVPKPSGGKGGGGGIVKPDTTWIDELTTKVKAKLDELAAAWSMVVASIQGYIVSLVNFAQSQWGLALPTILENLGSSLDELGVLWNQHGDFVTFAITLLWRTVVTVFTGSLTLISGIITAGLQIINGNWAAAWATALLTLISFINQALAIVNTDWPTFQKVWSTNFENLSIILTTALKIMSDGLNTWLNDTSAQLVAGGLKIGQGLVNGIISGISSVVGSLVAAATAAATAAMKAIKDALGIHSPSKEGLRLGLNFGKSIASGLLSSLGAIDVSASYAAAAMVAAPASTGGSQASVNNTYHGNTYQYSPSYGGAPSSPQTDFAIMAVWAR